MRIQNTPFGSNPFKRSVAIITAALFLSTQLLNFAPTAFAQLKVQGGTPSGLNRLVRDAEIRIPPELGLIDESFHGASGKTVVYLQDAHDSLEAQENIARIINHLVKNASVKTVFEEGFEGPVPTDKYFGFIKDPKIKEKVAYFLMDHLRVGGAEYAHINRTKDFNLIGADSLKLHKENIEQYRFSATKKDAITKDLKSLETELKSLTDSRFPKELKEWLKTKRQFDAKTLDLFTYLGRTMPLLGEHGAEKGLGLISFLIEAMKTNDPTVIEQAKHIDAREVFGELIKFEQAVADTYLHDTADKQLFEYCKILCLLNRLNDLQVSQEEYEAAKASLEAFDTDSFARFIFSQTPKILILSRMWERNIKDAVQFYEIAQERDRSLSQMLDGYSEGKNKKEELVHKPDVSVLVFGGFHKEAIKRILEAKGISYLVVSPHITKPSLRHEEFYKRLMTDGHLPYELPTNLHTASRPWTQFEIWNGNQPLARPELRIMASVAENMPNVDTPSLMLAMEQALKNPTTSSRSEMRGNKVLESKLYFVSERHRAYWEGFIKECVGLLVALEKAINSVPAQREALFLQMKKDGFLNAEAESILKDRLDDFANTKNPQGKPNYVSGEGYSLEGIRGIASFVPMFFSDYKNLRAELDILYEITSLLGEGRLQEGVRTELATMEESVEDVLAGVKSNEEVFNKLDLQDPNISNVLLKWLGNIAELNEYPREQAKAKEFLIYFVERMLRENKDILDGYAEFVHRKVEEARSKNGPKGVSVAVMLTGAELLGRFLEHKMKAVGKPIDFKPLLLTMAMVQNLDLFYDSGTPFLTGQSKAILERHFQRAGIVTPKTQRIIMIDTGFVGSLNNFIREVYERIPREYLILSHDKSGPPWFANLARGLNDEPQWQSADKRLHKLALIIDDGFEASTTSPIRFNEEGLPDGVVSTQRPWMHKMMLHQIEALADNSQVANAGGSDFNPAAEQTRSEVRKSVTVEPSQANIPTPITPEIRSVASVSKMPTAKPWQILRLKQDVIVVVEQARIDTLSPEMFKELLEIAGLNIGKLHLVIPDALQGKYSQRVAELRKVATVYYGFPQIAASDKIPVIGFSDMEHDGYTLTDFKKGIDSRLAERMKDSAFGLNRPGSFGVGILYALKDIPPDRLPPNRNGFRYDPSGWYSAQVLEVLQAYTVISTSA